jgi:TolB-like protein
MAGEIFISYRRSDEHWARLLHARLKAEGIDAWYDVQVGAGEEWRTATARALEASRIFVLLFSTAAAQSEEMAKELAAATVSRKLIVPVRLENIRPAGAFLYELAGRNWVNAFEDTEVRLEELAKSIAQLVRSGTSDPVILPFDRGPGRAKPVHAASRRPRARIIAAGVALAALVAAGLAYYLTHEREQGTLASQKTAFFGFDASGDDPGVKEIADSAANEVFDTLGAMRLATAARAETFGTPAKERFDRARELGAIYALGGEVLREATRITISIRLEDVASRSTLWSESVSGLADESVTLPVRAATLATDTLRCVSSIRTDLPRDNIEAVKLLPGFCREKRTTSLSSIPAFRGLAHVAPDVAEAQAGFAVATLIVLPNAPETARPALFAEAQAAAERAMKLDSRLPDAWLAEYWVAVRKNASLLEQDAILTAGLKVAPENATLNSYRSDVLQSAGRNRDALPYARLAVTNDPLSGPKQIGFANLLAIVGQTSEAEGTLEKLMSRTPSVGGWQRRITHAVLHNVGDPAQLLAAPPAMISAAIVECWRSIFAAYRSGDSKLRRAGVETVKACLAHGDVGAGTAISLIASLGDSDGAFASIDGPAKPGSSRSAGNFSYLFWPSTQVLRADPRFASLVEDLGLMDYWRKTGTHPDVCDTEKPPFCAALNPAAATQ